MLTLMKSLAGDLLAQAYYLLCLRSHTDLVLEHFQSQNLPSLCLTTAIQTHLDRVDTCVSKVTNSDTYRQSRHDPINVIIIK